MIGLLGKKLQNLRNESLVYERELELTRDVVCGHVSRSDGSDRIGEDIRAKCTDI
jgi:hypothetical protein